MNQNLLEQADREFEVGNVTQAIETIRLVIEKEPSAQAYTMLQNFERNARFKFRKMIAEKFPLNIVAQREYAQSATNEYSNGIAIELLSSLLASHDLDTYDTLNIRVQRLKSACKNRAWGIVKSEFPSVWSDIENTLPTRGKKSHLLDLLRVFTISGEGSINTLQELANIENIPQYVRDLLENHANSLKILEANL